MSKVSYRWTHSGCFFFNHRWHVGRPEKTEEPGTWSPVWDRGPGRLHRLSAEQSGQNGYEDSQHKPTDKKTQMKKKMNTLDRETETNRSVRSHVSSIQGLYQACVLFLLLLWNGIWMKYLVLNCWLKFEITFQIWFKLKVILCTLRTVSRLYREHFPVYSIDCHCFIGGWNLTFYPHKAVIHYCVSEISLMFQVWALTNFLLWTLNCISM